MIHVAREKRSSKGFHTRRIEEEKKKTWALGGHRFRQAKASTNDSAHARMRLPTIRYFNRPYVCVCVCIKRQPCWCKTRTRGDSSSVAAHSFLLLRKTQDIPLSISALFFLFFHLQTPSRTRALCPNCLR